MGESAPVRPRPMLMSTRQIAVAAIFGGLALIATGLGLQLPGYLPGVNFNLVGTFLSIATMAAGPFGGIIVTFLESFVSPVGFYGWPLYWPHIFLLALFFPRVYALQNKAVRLAAYWLLTSVALFFQYWAWFFLYVYVFKFFPNVWVLAAFNFLGGAYWVFLLIYALIPSIVLASFPDFVKPDWRFPALKWVTLASVLIIVVAIIFFPGAPA